MKVELSLSKREADAVLRAELSTGYGCRRTQALRTAEFKLRQSIIAAQNAKQERIGPEEFNPLGGAMRGVGRCVCAAGRGTNPACQVHP